MSRDQFDPVGLQQVRVERIAVVATVADQSRRERLEEARGERGVDEA